MGGRTEVVDTSGGIRSWRGAQRDGALKKFAAELMAATIPLVVWKKARKV